MQSRVLPVVRQEQPVHRGRYQEIELLYLSHQGRCACITPQDSLMTNESLSLTLEESLSHLSLDEFLNMFKTSHLEHFGVLYHGSSGLGSIIGFALICSGSCWKIKNISLQKIMDEAFRVGAKGMTLVHNHPSSGALRPSVTDLQTTFKIHDIAKKDGVPVLDHVIYGVDDGEFSFIENGIEI